MTTAKSNTLRIVLLPTLPDGKTIKPKSTKILV